MLNFGKKGVGSGQVRERTPWKGAKRGAAGEFLPIRQDGKEKIKWKRLTLKIPARFSKRKTYWAQSKRRGAGGRAH